MRVPGEPITIESGTREKLFRHSLRALKCKRFRSYDDHSQNGEGRCFESDDETRAIVTKVTFMLLLVQ